MISQYKFKSNALPRLTCAMIKQTSSSPNPLTIDILTYRRKDSATDVIGIKA